MPKKHLCHLPRRAACLALAALMTLSTVLTGCGVQDIHADALEDGHDHSASIVSAGTVSLRETLAGSLNDELAAQAGVLSDAYWDTDVPATEKDVIYEYAVNEDVLAVVDDNDEVVEYTSNFDTGSSVDIDSVETSTVEKNYDEWGLRETPHEVRVMYTTVDESRITENEIGDMWDDNYEAFISSIMMQQPVYEVDRYSDCYVAFLNYSALNGTNGRVVDADFTRGTERHPVDMSDQVVFDRDSGVVYLPKAWYFAGDGTEVSLDLTAQVMVAVDTKNENMTDEQGNLLSHISVTVENEAGRDTVLGNGTYESLAYDYAMLPLFEAGSVDGIRKDDIEVYLNGSAEPLDASELGYNPDDGMLTINKVAMSVTDVRVVFPKKGLFASAADMFSIGTASAADSANFLENIMDSGMKPIYNVTKYEQTHNMEQSYLRPNIDLTKLTAGDVLAYFTLGTYGSRYTSTYQDMWTRGAENFVYGSNFTGELTRSDTYWMMVGNKGVTLKTDYTLGKKDSFGFIIELPFSSDSKPQNARNPVIVHTDGNKLQVGDRVFFGNQEDWQWIDLSPDFTVGGESGIYYSHAIPGQCSHTEDSTYEDGSGTEVTGFTCKHDVPEDFSCECGKDGEECSECKQYRDSKGLSKCDANCPHCKDGRCEKCAGTCEQFRLQYNMEFCTDGCKQCMSGECDSCKDMIFRCTSCNCAECMSFREEYGIDFCNRLCPHCSSGTCSGCSTAWINGALADFDASATVRILAVGSDYLILGLAQLDSGDSQRGTSVIKVKTIVELKINKESSTAGSPSDPMNMATANNPCYGDTHQAEYTVYRDAACTNAVGTIKANDSDKLQLQPGMYYIKETKAALGYYIDTEVHAVNVNKNMTWQTTNRPMQDPVSISVAQKNIAGRNTAGTTAGDIGPLENIQFDIYYYKGEYTSIASLPAADEHAVFKTDANGRLRFASRYLVAGQTWKYKNALGSLYIPMGTVMIREKTPIDGLIISNSHGMLFTITDKSDKTDSSVTYTNYHGTRTIYEGSSGATPSDNGVVGTYENAPVKGGVTVSKADADWNTANPQGDAGLAGAQFALYNRSAADVLYKGNYYAPGSVMDTLTVAYDSGSGQYKASTGARVLEYGTYEIRETKAPDGYNLADWSRTFTIRQDGQMHNFTQSASSDTSSGLNFYHQWCRDAVMRGGVTIEKVDRETKQPISLGAAKLAGTTFQIINRSRAAVRVKGRDYAPGQVIMTLTSANSDGTNTCTTGNHVLPYGTYEVKETGAAIGYLFDGASGSQMKTFSIRSNGQMVDLTGESNAFHNQVQREDWYFTKKYDDTGERMARVAWTVTSVTTGETHVIVTDENGKYDSEQAKHSTRPNANDPDSPISNGAIGINGSGEYYVKDSSKLDYDAGTWFTGLRPDVTQWAPDGRSYTVKGGNGTVVPVNDGLRAYPYDTYIVRELSSDVNEGYNLVSFTVTLKRYSDDHNSNGIKLDYGTVDDQTKGTMAMYTDLYYNETGFVEDSHCAPAKNGLIVTDTVTFGGLNAGRDFTLRGSLHLIDENGNDLGEVATNSVNFTGASLGQVKMDFSVNAEGWEGKSLVAYEEIICDGDVVAWENDPENEEQRVWLSGITGTRADKVYTSAKAGTLVTVTDEIDYKNLEIGTPYVATLTLVDTNGNVLYDIDGNPITSDTWFIPGTNNGTETVSVTFGQPEGFAGTTAVVYEEISRGDGNLYGWHKDLNDASQTVRFTDMVDTYAVNGSSHTKEISADAGQSIQECIKLADMRSDTTYRLEGTLYWLDDDGTANAVLNADGSPMTATINNPGREETMVFSNIDATELGGRDLVVYQILYGKKNGSSEWEIAFEHCYPDDLDQIVHVPMIDTTLSSHTTGIHHDSAGQVTLVDRVDYWNLVPGQRYTMTGKLHIREDAEADGSFEAVDMGEVSGATASVEFVPESKDGYVELVFNYDASALDGKVVVAFEELRTAENREAASGWEQFFRSKAAAGDRRVAHHMDITDIVQSLGFARITSTELTGEGIYTKIVDGVITVIEKLEWDGLIPGFDYDVDEVFDEASEEAKVQISTNGVFTPETVKGSISVSVTRDVQTEVRKNVLLARENMKLTDYINYEGLIPGMKYTLTSRLMVKNEDGSIDEEPLITMEGTFIPDSVNGTLQSIFMFDASDLAGKDIVAYERITQDGVLVAAHEDPNDNEQTVKFPKVETLFAGKDYSGEATEPIKVIEFNTYSGHQDVFGVGQIQVDSVEIVDTVTVSNLIPGLTYKVKGEVHLKGNYNELHDFIETDMDLGRLYCTAEAEFTPDKSTETLQLVYHVVPIGINKADLVAFEYVFIDDELIGRHADIKDEQQTVTIIGKDISSKLDTVLEATESVITNNPYEDAPDAAEPDGSVDGTVDEGNVDGTPDADSDEGTGDITSEGTGDTQDGAADGGDTMPDDGSDDAPAADGPIKVVEYFAYGSHRDKPIHLRDTVEYTGLVVGTEYTLKSEVHIRNRYGADMGTIATGEDIVFKPEAETGTLTVDFTVDPSQLPSESELDDMNIGLVAFEYLYEGDELVSSHAKMNDADQTVTVQLKEITVSIDTVLSGTEAVVSNNPAGTKPDAEPGTNEPGTEDSGDEPGTEEPGTEEPGTEDPDESSDAEEPGEGDDGTDVSAKKDESEDGTDESAGESTDESTDEDGNEDVSGDNVEGEPDDGVGDNTEGEPDGSTDDGPQSVWPIKTIEYYTYAGHMDADVTLKDTVSYKDAIVGTEYTLKGELRIRNRYGNDIGVLTTGEDVTFTPTAPSGTVEMTFTFNPSDMPADATDLVAYEYLYEGGELETWHTDIADADQSVTILVKDDSISIDTEMKGVRVDMSKTEGEKAEEEPAKSVEFYEYEETDRFGKTTHWSDTVTLIDVVSYHNLTPGATYRLDGELHMKGRFGIDLGNIGVDETVTFTPEEPDGSVEVRFTVDPMEIQDAELVSFQYLYEVPDGDSEDAEQKPIAVHADIADEDQTVAIARHVEPDPDPEPSIMDTVLIGGKGDDTDLSDGCSAVKDEKNHKVIEFNRRWELDKSGNTKVTYDKVTLTDVVMYKDLEPDVEYELKGEIHLKDVYNRDLETISTTSVKFKPNAYEGQIEVTFEIDPEKAGNIANVVAFEYLYRDGKLVASHDCIFDKDQTVTLVAKGNICGCDDPDCDHKDDRDHCTKPGCCDDSDCCKDCDDCDHKNICGCDDPDCKHKDDKDHCINNPGCCDDSDCCKDCKTCQHKNLCGCSDPDCKHKYEKNHCVNNPGCCDDTNCCKDCKDCKSKAPADKKNPCGCTDPNCKNKDKVNHCINNPGCCDDANCCKSCSTCKQKPSNNGNGNGNTPNGSSTTKPSKNPIQNIINTVKTGENTFLLMSLIGLTAMSGGGYFFLKTASGREMLKKLRKKLSELFGRK